MLMDRSSSSPGIMIDISDPTFLEPPTKVRRAISAGPSDFSSVIAIHVGIKPSRKTFMLHAHALRSSSNHFATVIDARCASAEDDRPINFSDVSVDDFGVYAKFLYTGLIFTKEANVAELTRCLHLYDVAKQLDATDFMDALVDALIENIADFRTLKGQCRFTASQIHTIYTMTEETAPLRKFAQDLCLQSKGPQGFEKKRMKDFPIDFQLDLLNAAAPFITTSARSSDMQDPLDLNQSCRYHQHAILGIACYRKKYQFAPEESAAIAASAAPMLFQGSASGRQSKSLSNDFELRV